VKNTNPRTSGRKRATAEAVGQAVDEVGAADEEAAGAVAVANEAPVDANRADVGSVVIAHAAESDAPKGPDPSDKAKNHGVRSAPRPAPLLSDLRGDIVLREDIARKAVAPNARDRKNHEARGAPPSEVRNGRRAPNHRVPLSSRLITWMISGPGYSKRGALLSLRCRAAVKNTASLSNGPTTIGASHLSRKSAALVLKNVRSAKESTKARNRRKPALSELLKKADVRRGVGGVDAVRVRDEKDRQDRWIGRRM
jgi:hypothetical protein